MHERERMLKEELGEDVSCGCLVEIRTRRSRASSSALWEKYREVSHKDDPGVKAMIQVCMAFAQ
jgi:hypothetical protein